MSVKKGCNCFETAEPIKFTITTSDGVVGGAAYFPANWAVNQRTTKKVARSKKQDLLQFDVGSH